MFDSNPKIKMPLEIQNLWNDFGNWWYEVSFSLQGGRGVYKELFDEYQQITNLEGALNKITENEECLVNYRFYCDSLIPMFPIYADGKKYVGEWEDDKQHAESPAGGDAINQASRVKREAVAT